MEERLPTKNQILAAARGDPRARDRLMAGWGPAVLRWCARLGGPTVEPEDVAHDVLVSALTNLHQLRRPEAFPAWLFSITRREVGRHRRRAWLAAALPARLRSVLAIRPPQPRSPQHIVEQAEAVRLVQDAIEALPAQQREVLVLCDLEGRAMQAAATLLGIPAGTVKSRLHAARAGFERQVRRRMALQPELVQVVLQQGEEG